MAKERKFNIGKIAEAAEQTLRPSAPLPQPSEESKTSSESTPLPQETPTKFRGRKKVVRTIPKQNGKTLYFEEKTNQQLRQVAWNTQLDMQDIVRVAVNDFLNNFANGDKLNEEGRNKVIEYVKATSKVLE